MKKKCIMCQMDTTKFICMSMDINKLYFHIEQGIIMKIELTENQVCEPKDMSPAIKERMEMAYYVCQKILGSLDDMEDLCEPITDKIQEVMSEYKVSKSTIYRWFRTYLQSGKSYWALAPDYNKCGGKGKEKTYNKRPGRKGESEALLSEEIKQMFDAVIEEYFFKHCLMSVKKLYEEMLCEYNYTVFNKDNRYSLSDPKVTPTQKQFRSYFKKNVSKAEIKVNQIGMSNAMNNYRPLLSDSKYGLFGIGSRFEVDEMELDFYSVDPEDKDQYIGRHIMYMMVDVYSGLIVGLYVGLENNSFNGFKNVLINMVEDKVEFCKRYGIDIEVDDWNVKGFLPFKITADNGSEYVSNHTEELAKLGIEINNVKAGMGSYKGTIEQRFNQFNKAIDESIPGKIRKFSTGRDERKYAKATCFDLMKIAIYFTLFYNEHIILSYKLTEKMLQDDLIPSPKNIWNYAMERKNVSLHSIDSVANFILNLMDKDNLSVTKEGFAYKKMLYVVADEENKQWQNDRFTKAAIEGTEKMRFFYDNRCMNFIYIFINNELMKLKLNSYKTTNEKYLNCSLKAVVLINSLSRENNKKWDKLNLYSNLNLIHNIKNNIQIGNKKIQSSSITFKNSRKEKERIKQDLGIEDSIHMHGLLAQNDTMISKKSLMELDNSKNEDAKFWGQKGTEGD